jgi:hypothetical protein
LGQLCVFKPLLRHQNQLVVELTTLYRFSFAGLIMQVSAIRLYGQHRVQQIYPEIERFGASANDSFSIVLNWA